MSRPLVLQLRRMSSKVATSAAAGGKVDAGEAKVDVESKAQEQAAPKPTGLVMQIVVRRDLQTTHGWPTGPLMAQAAHAASAVQHLHASHPDMQRYLTGDDGRGWMNMRKALLEVPDDAALNGLHDALEKAGVPHHLWIEEPEHYPTALALVPNKRPKAIKRMLDEAGATLWK